MVVRHQLPGQVSLCRVKTCALWQYSQVLKYLWKSYRNGNTAGVEPRIESNTKGFDFMSIDVLNLFATPVVRSSLKRGFTEAEMTFFQKQLGDSRMAISNYSSINKKRAGRC